jgi:hypothetical protein
MNTAPRDVSSCDELPCDRERHDTDELSSLELGSAAKETKGGLLGAIADSHLAYIPWPG